MTPRQCAVIALYEIEQNGAYSDKALKKELAASELSPQDRAFATELVYGVVKNKMRLDFIIQHYSSQKLKKISVWILNILRIGVYQMIFLDKIPHSAAVNESVKLAKRYGHSASSAFVNGVLRSVSREGDVEYPSGKEYYSIFYSHPMWLIDMLYDQYGKQTATEIIKANNENPPVTIRTNSLKTSPPDLAKSLESSGVTVVQTEFMDVFQISKFGDISKLQQFKDGLFTVQDTAAYLAGKAVNPQKNDFIIDMCAAPGGKTTHIAEMCGDDAKIIAFDLHPHKIEIIEKNAIRLGIKSIKPIVCDASALQNKFIGKADKVLVDVPCSGLGIIRKKPDIKWRKTLLDITEIIKTQKQIINVAGQYVKPSGILVYSTCTVNKYENNGVINEFILNNPFTIIEEKTLLPHIDGCDGFYICKLMKNS